MKPEPNAAFLPDPTLTPGRYMRKCREAAKVSCSDCARKIAPFGGSSVIARAEREIALMEKDTPGDYGQLVRWLAASKPFAFDLGTFLQLAAATCDADLQDAA